LGHVEDLAVAMANVIGREDRTTGKVYNVQNTQAVSFDGLCSPSGFPRAPTTLVHWNWRSYQGFGLGTQIRTNDFVQRMILNAMIWSLKRAA
jgi:hypothetical protein